MDKEEKGQGDTQMNKKIKFALSSILGICILVGISFGFDSYRVKEGKKPLFCLKTVDMNQTNGDIQEFIGMGYKIIRFNKLLGWTREDVRYFKENKIGTWFMKPEDFDKEFAEAKRKLDEENSIFVPFEELLQDYTIEQAILDGCLVITQEGVYHASEIDEFTAFVNLEQKISLRIVTLTREGDMLLTDVVFLPEQKVFQIREDNTRDQYAVPEERCISEFQEYLAKDFQVRTNVKKNMVILSLYELETEEEREICSFLVNQVKPNREYQSFEGKILEVDKSHILIEPEEGASIRKVADQFRIKRNRWENNNYSVGTKVQVTYSRIVKVKIPPELENAIINERDFEIHFTESENKNDQDSYPILSQETGYAYSVYTYQGFANILLKGKEMGLETALKSNKITIDDILAKAQQDAKNELIKVAFLPDGGTTLYYYDTCTIIKYHTLKGNEDVYITKPNLQLNELPM